MQEASFLDTLSIWGRQERFSSIITPRNFVSDTCLTARPFSNKQGIGVNDGPMIELRMRDALGLKYMKLHLLKLMCNKLLCILHVDTADDTVCLFEDFLHSIPYNKYVSIVSVQYEFTFSRTVYYVIDIYKKEERTKY